MQISFVAPADIRSGAWVVGAVDGGVLLPAAGRADKASGGALTRALKFSSFTGKAGQFLEVVAPAGLAASRILLAGLGKPESAGRKGAGDPGRPDRGPALCRRRERRQHRAGCPQREARSRKRSWRRIWRSGRGSKAMPSTNTAPAIWMNIEKKLKTVAVVTPDVAAAKKAHAGLAAVADGIFLARDLVNEPPNVLYPAEFARRAKAQLSKLGVKVEVLGEAEMKRQGFGALLGVGQGSVRESQLVVMQWNGGKKSAQAAGAGRQGRVFRYRRHFASSPATAWQA